MLFRSPGDNTDRHLFFISDTTSSRKFLVDNGSSFSLLPFQSRSAPYGPTLLSAGGRRIRTWGTTTSTITINQQQFSWSFVRAEVRWPILGIDFLRAQKLVVDVAAERLIPRSFAAAAAGVFTVESEQASGGPSAAGRTAQGLSSSPASSTSPSASQWHEIIAEFPGIADTFSAASTPSHKVSHHIETSGRPVTARFCQ